MAETHEGNAKRNYKDSLFRRIFGDKEKLLSLYNAVNGTHYENAEELEINTLDNAVYLNVKNDLSFIFAFQMNLYEHQSTYNANMPLRYLYFITKLYQPQFDDRSLYSSRRRTIPAPVFVVFYNSTEDRPERWIEKLSDSFEVAMKEPKLELEVLVLNVNYGKNQKLMEQCQTLKEYAIYVAKVRKYAETMSTAEAVERAVTESIKENILADFLRRYRSEAIQMSILEYDEERELRLIRKEEYEIGKEAGMAEGKAEGRTEGFAEGKAEGLAEGKAEGLAEGKAEGLAEGKAEGRIEGKTEGLAEGKAEGRIEGKTEGRVEILVDLVRKIQAAGKSPQEISKILELELNLVLKIMELSTGNAGLRNDEIIRKLLEEYQRYTIKD